MRPALPEPEPGRAPLVGPAAKFLLRWLVGTLVTLGAWRLGMVIVPPRSVPAFIAAAAIFGLANALLRPIANIIAERTWLPLVGIAQIAIGFLLMQGLAWLAGTVAHAGFGFPTGFYNSSRALFLLCTAVVLADHILARLLQDPDPLS